jgi:general secretion pathway protein E
MSATKAQNLPLNQVLLRLGLVEEGALAVPLSKVLGLPLFDKLTYTVDRTLTEQLGQSFLSGRLVVPLAGSGPTIPFAMANPADSQLRSELTFLLEQEIDVVVATSAEIRTLIASLDGSGETERVQQSSLSAELDLRRLAESDGPVIRFVSEKLADAVSQAASDIHLENTETGLQMRFRINGILVPQRMDHSLDPAAVVARFKVMAGVNVAERRLPQDGRMEALIAGRKIDFRFSSLPTHNGESIAARVLDPKQMRRGLDSLGFPPDIAGRIRAILNRPSGLFLATGPTGSGKTTTLYAAISHLNDPRRKIVTVEDPVEYNLPGVQQVQVHDEIGLTFARVLRGILRHDPNVILIGEIRDQETAEIAVRAAQVGRLVLSTLHTNSAAGAVTRLVDLGVPEFLVRDVLRGVLGQELWLVPCGHCGGAGCETCGRTGVGQRELRAELLEF